MCSKMYHLFLVHEDVVETLLNYGANVGPANRNGWTALHFAARYGKFFGIKNNWYHIKWWGMTTSH